MLKRSVKSHNACMYLVQVCVHNDMRQSYTLSTVTQFADLSQKRKNYFKS
jgi:hypothetical protein